MNLSVTYSQNTGGLASPSRPPFSPHYNGNERLTRNPTFLIGQVSNSMVYYNRSSSERLQVPSRRSSHSSRTMRRRSHSDEHTGVAKACMTNGSNLSHSTCAQQLNDSMIYMDGPQVYACAKCRTHLTSHDEIISKSFHGRHGRAFLFDHCVNVDIGPAEERPLMTGLHSVCDIFCRRCKGMVGWTYIKAYEASQKYKEGKFILEKINLHLEASDHYRVAPPPGEKNDRFRARSISWGSNRFSHLQPIEVYEYDGASKIRGLDLSDSKQTSGGDLSEQCTVPKCDTMPRL